MYNVQIDVDKIRRQLELEQEGIELGVQRYQEAVRNEDLTDLPPGSRLLINALKPTIAKLDEFKKSTINAGRLHYVRHFLNTLESADIAFITAQHCLNAMSTPTLLQTTSVSLGAKLKDHFDYLEFKQANPGYLFTVEKNLRTAHLGHRRIVIMRALRKLNMEAIRWTDTEKFHVGIKCVEIFIEATGLVEKTLVGEKYRLTPSPEVIKWIDQQHAKCEILNPYYLPMIVPPQHWTSCYDGGYLTQEATLAHTIIKSRDHKAIEKINDNEMPKVYRALNAVQDTPWRINQKVYEVMRDAWISRSTLGGLPSQEEDPEPPKPWATQEEGDWWKENKPKEFKDWKAAATGVHDVWHRSRSKRDSMIRKLWLAEKFCNESEIYFCWNMDWRGRMYPIQSHITPQGDDTGKALIEFATGKPAKSAPPRTPFPLLIEHPFR